MPRFKRGIQYSAEPLSSLHEPHGILDRPVKPGDDGKSIA